MRTSAGVRPAWAIPDRRLLATAALRLGVLAAAVLASRLLSAVDDQVGVGVGLAVTIALPGLMFLRVACPAGVPAIDRLGLLPVAALAPWGAALAVGYVLGLRFQVVAGLLLVASALALPLELPSRRAGPRSGRLEIAAVCTGGLAFTLVAQAWQTALIGDVLFHAGLVRKLLGNASLSLGGVSPYRGGHPHEGYAFPVLHAVEAGAVWISGLDPSAGYINLVPAAAFFVPVCVYAAGNRMGGPAVGAMAALFACWDSASRIYLGLVSQPPYFTFAILFPCAVLVLAHLYRDDRRGAWAAWTALVGLEVALVHPTYSIALAPLIVAVCLLRRSRWPALTAYVLVTAAVDAWIYLVAVHGGHGLSPASPEPGQMIELGGHLVSSTGQAVLAHRVEFVLALGAAFLIIRRRLANPLPGALMLAMVVFVSLPGVLGVVTQGLPPGQVERFWNVIPWEYPAAQALVLAGLALRSRVAVAVAAGGLAVASVVLEAAGGLWGMGGPHTTRWPVEQLSPVVSSLTVPDLVMAVVAVLAAVALVAEVRLGDRARRPRFPVPAATPAAFLLLAALFVGPLMRDLPRVSATVRNGSANLPPTNILSPGVIDYFRSTHFAHTPVVLAPYSEPNDGIAYQLAGNATVYVTAVSEPHSRATPLDDPQGRRALVDTFLAPSTSEQERRAILTRLGVDDIVLDLPTTAPETARALRRDPALQVVYRDPPTTPPRPDRFIVLAVRHPG